MKHIRNVLAALRKADELFSLIDNGDVICLGISGGKDSLCLLKAMAIYGKFSKKDFRIVPVSLDLGFPGFDPKPMQDYAKSLGLELLVEDSREVYPILQEHTKPGGHIPCSICSRMKKAAINAVAKREGCNKVAFAHHKDDAIETLFMNMVHGGKIATFEPYMRLDRAEITFIRPLILASEEDLAGMAKEENLPVMGKTCPADGYTERQWTKDLLSRIYEERPEAVANLSQMLYDYEGSVLYFSHIEWKENDGTPYSLKPLVTAAQAVEYQEKAKEMGLPLLPSSETHYLLGKAHEMKGHISFHRPIGHEVLIAAFEAQGSEEEKEAWLDKFLRHEERKENPIEFVYVGESNREAFLALGFAPRGESLFLKVFR